MESFAYAQAGIYAGRNSTDTMGGARELKRVLRWMNSIGVAEELNARKDHRSLLNLSRTRETLAGGVRVTRFNALFHWAVPPGREIETGGEVGRHHILTHCYWREAGPEFKT